MTTQPRRRRFPRSFGLRTLLVLVVVLAIPMAWIASERRQSDLETQIAWQLQDLGSNFVSVGSRYYSSERASQHEPQGWWRDLAEEVLGQRVVGVSASVPDFTDLTPLAACNNLDYVEVENTQVSNLAPLSNATNLRVLWLGHTQVKDVAPLAGLRNLDCLSLDDTHVSDLAPLAGLTNLRVLWIIQTPVSDQQVAWLRKALPNCEIYK